MLQKALLAALALTLAACASRPPQMADCPFHDITRADLERLIAKLPSNANREAPCRQYDLIVNRNVYETTNGQMVPVRLTRRQQMELPELDLPQIQEEAADVRASGDTVIIRLE